MWYPIFVLEDKTGITNCEMLENGTIRVLCEKPVSDDFFSASLIIPSYEWQNVKGFTPDDLEFLQKTIKANANRIIYIAERRRSQIEIVETSVSRISTENDCATR